ncbi:C-Jun-amino-terminal kinase-interacting protein 4 [Bienertia sinuspersici]
MGDFNCVLNIEEKIGNAVRAGEMEAARCCMETCGMQDIPYSGHYYTWSNKQVASERVFTKLDRVMANDQWLEVYKSMNAVFLAEGCSDHCPALLRMNQGEGNGKKPFKYFRMWQQASDYKSRIKDAWEVQAAERLAYQQLLEAQDAIQTDPHNAQLIEKEINADKEYREKHKNYMQFLRQKAKIEWVREGDENSALFHSNIRKRRIQNTVYTIKDKAGVFHDTPDGVQEAFLDYYQELLGSNIGDRRPVNREIVQSGPVGLFKWINKKGNKHKVYKATWNAAATAIVYSIWKERNDIIHGSPVSDMQQIIQKIKFWVKERIRMIDKSSLGAEQIDWLDNL